MYYIPTYSYLWIKLEKHSSNPLCSSSQPVFLSAVTLYSAFLTVWYLLSFLSCLFFHFLASSSPHCICAVIATVSHMVALPWSTSINTFRWSWPSVSPLLLRLFSFLQEALLLCFIKRLNSWMHNRIPAIIVWKHFLYEFFFMCILKQLFKLNQFVTVRLACLS